MKRLFEVIRNGEHLSPPIYFDKKRGAKDARDLCNMSMKGHHVTLGPDHNLYGVHGVPRTVSHSRKKVTK